MKKKLRKIYEVQAKQATEIYLRNNIVIVPETPSSDIEQLHDGTNQKTDSNQIDQLALKDVSMSAILEKDKSTSL